MAEYEGDGAQTPPEILRAYRAVFKTPAGEKVLKNIEWICRVRHSVTEEEYQGRPIDPVKLQIHEGMRRVYWKIVSALAAADMLSQEE